MAVDEQPHYVFVVRGLPDEVSELVRLRRWLKIGLRAFGLKCVALAELPPERCKDAAACIQDFVEISRRSG